MIDLKVKSIEQIRQLFENTSNYHANRNNFRKFIHDNNQEKILMIIIEIKQILSNPKKTPISKLLAVRFIKQSLNCISYGFLTLVASQICPHLLKLALYAKQKKQQDRARTMFLNQQNDFSDKKELEIIGFSLQKLVLEMYMKLDQWIPYCPYHKLHIHSIFSKHKAILDKQKVSLPEKFTYFTNKDAQKFFRQYNVQNSKDIESFYAYVINQYHRTKTQKYVQLFINIMKTGDTFCVQWIIEHIIKHLPQPYIINFTHKLLIEGDIQMLRQYQNKLLAIYLSIYVKQKNPQIREELRIWSYVFKHDKYIDNNNYFQRIYSCLCNASSEDMQNTKNLFESNQAALNNVNCNKLLYLNWEIDQITKKNSQVQQLIKQLQNNKDIKIAIQEDTEVFTNSFQIKSSDFNTKREHKIFNSSQIPKLNLFDKNVPSFVEHLKSDMIRYDQNIQSDVQILKSIRTKRSTKSVNKDNYSTTSMNFKRQYDVKDDHLSIYSDIYQKRINQLTKQKEQVIERQKTLQSLLKKKNQQILLLTPTKKSTHVQLYTDKKAATEQRKSFNLDSRAQIERWSIFPIKTKKQILKSKVLLFKNTFLEVGIITHLENQKLFLDIYITPFIDTNLIVCQARMPDWLNHTIIGNKSKQKTKAAQQFHITTYLTLKAEQKRKHLNSLPELQITMDFNDKIQVMRMYLPILITKFCRYYETTLVEYESLRKQKTKSQYMKLEARLIKSFDTFKKYFSTAIQIHEKQFAVGILFEKYKGVLIVQVNNIEVKIQILKSTLWNEQTYECLKNSYISVLTA